MQFFLTLLASIASLSAYNLVGVHAVCALCPDEVIGEWLTKTCVDKLGFTFCRYVSEEIVCLYTSDGMRQGSFEDCPSNVGQQWIGCNPC
ncbi:hypothetical protein PAXRUDRAFT_836140 [Paxillus rubicundulus Ve08.2h10]|uniref:Extracellular membrane protein CFEM domain-containing protein n=1 Tax=Paxillus rubicundulus Ve08.2h10 TaxID=930991 RepID=A0A0D0CSJ1_9AGAM|nr:hypothetical protein PAXRUDRAFT_836140 [Paxillus rubicundulus Ve08.2h10]